MKEKTVSKGTSKKDGKKPSKKTVEKQPDILTHKLIPEHVILSAADTKTLLDRYNIQKENLPSLNDTDVMVKQMGAKIGDVIEIRRSSITAGESLYYRVVVSEDFGDES